MISRFIKTQLKSAFVLGALLTAGSTFAQLGLTWSEMGPNDIAGRCRSLLISKADGTGKTMYAGGVSGGVFKTTDGAATWSPVNDLSGSLIVSSLDQTNDGSTIYFGTGETFGRGGNGAGASGFLGSGLYKFAANSNSIILVKDSTTFGNINEIAVDNSNNIYVASDKGFFTSNDGGATFLKETASGTLAAMDVKIASNGDVYYSAGSKSLSSSKVFRRDASTTTFNDITPTFITDRGRIEIAVSSVDPNYVYISIAKQKISTTASTGGLSAILGSTSKGSTWSTITLGTAQFDPFLSLGTTGVGDYANTIVASSVKKDAFYVGGEVLYRWDQIASNAFGQGTFIQLGNPFATNSQLFLHSKIHDIKISSNPSIYFVATDAGVFKSDVPPTGFPLDLTPFLSYNKGLNISQFNSVAFPNFPRINQGTQTNVAVPYAGVAGGSVGNSLTYLPGYYSNGIQTSKSFGSTDAYQSDFSRIVPQAVFYAGASGSILRTSDIDVAPVTTFYDNSYKGGGSGSPGSSTFANENTPMRLWENYNNLDSAIFYNEVVKTSFVNNNSAQTTFTVLNARPQASAKYDTIFVKTTSSKKAFKSVATTQTFTNTNTTAATFTVANTRSNVISKYDSVVVNMTSFKKSTITPIVTTYTNMNNTASTFTFSNIRPMASAKYDSIIIVTASTKSLGPVPGPQTISIIPTYSFNTVVGCNILGSSSPVGTNTVFIDNTTFNDSIRFTFDFVPLDSSTFTVRVKYKYSETMYMLPSYSGSVISSYGIVGESNNVPATNNSITLNNTTLNDVVKFTFTDAPNDSSVISVRLKNSYYQTIAIMPNYTGSNISSYNIIGETNNTPTTNIAVKLNNTTLSDTIRYTFRNAPNDSCVISHTIKLKYLAGDQIKLTNADISGGQFTTTVTLTSNLLSSSSPTYVPLVKLPLSRSARLAVGTSYKSASEAPNVYVVKRPLNFSINPDWVKIAGKNSRIDDAGGVPSSTVAPVLGTTVTRLEWANDGRSIYFSTKLNDTTFYLYRVSHIGFIGDSSDVDYGGQFSADIDSMVGSTQLVRKKVGQRTTPIGKFKYPITSISVLANNSGIMVTTGGYTNKTGTVYYSNGDVRLLNMNVADASNFSIKNGSTLPFIPAYSSLFEMNDNKRALIGTENGIYSTSDITASSPVWVKETGGNFPNVPVFQIRQQTYPSYQCYNSGIIYAATHGRGIWSTDKYLTNYAIGIQESEQNLSFNTNVLLFPNPAADATNIWFKASGDANYKIRVYDVSGRTLIEQTTGKLMEGEQVITLNTNALNSGVYFVSVNGTNNFNATSKLVISR